MFGCLSFSTKDIPTDMLAEGAAHEWGHAKVGSVLGLEVVRMTVQRANSTGVKGFTYFNDDLEPDPHDPAFEEYGKAYLTMCLAGQECQVHYLVVKYGYTRDAALAKTDNQCAADLDNFRRFARYFHLTESSARSRCQKIIVAYWSQISSGIDKLYERGQMSGRSV